VLLLPGDIFASRAPDPVLQQVEDFQAGDVSANDCFRPVTRYFDRITRPEQILTALQTLLGTNNVAVSIDAVHYCVKARGVRDATSATTTTSLGGLFKSSQNTRQEFLRAVRHHN
jgi:TPP-dependent trihydroxycyclohexane-1,2-dione (THcHDO) dehydratase